MATGDLSDVLARIKSTIPRSWYADATPIHDALLSGLAQAWANIYSLYAYAKLQTRIKTATDGWLDLIAGDFFGTRISRRSNQTDASFRANIIANLFRERATRKGLIRVLTDLTGRTPIVIEPQQPNDCGAYGISTTGYGAAGYYGSTLMPSQCFVIAYRPASAGLPSIAGYGNSQGAYGSVGSQSAYGSLANIIGQVTDTDIYNAIDSVKPVATVLWTDIQS